jgi:hypothetical protein
MILINEPELKKILGIVADLAENDVKKSVTLA